MFAKKKLVVVICEGQLENTLIDDLHEMKVYGYTICEAKGEGSRGVRAGDWEQNRNIRLEIVCSEKEAERVFTHIKNEYFENYAMITYMSEVEVIRGDKFV